jgi:hypothetical protein
LVQPGMHSDTGSAAAITMTAEARRRGNRRMGAPIGEKCDDVGVPEKRKLPFTILPRHLKPTPAS